MMGVPKLSCWQKWPCVMIQKFGQEISKPFQRYKPLFFGDPNKRMCLCIYCKMIILLERLNLSVGKLILHY